MGATRVYSAGNIVTYHVDSGVTYQEEVDDGESCLSPKTFTPAKSGWEFVGWRQDTAAPADGSVESSVPMGDDPITLYAVFRKLIAVTYYNNSTSASTISGYRYYNNGSVVNPSFTLTQASAGGWTARGWSTSNQGNAGITYANGATFTRGSNITIYGLYQQTVTVTYYNGNRTALSTSGTRYWAPAGTINPSFTLTQAGISGWTARGWSTGTAANGGITYNNGASFTRDSNITLYGMYQQTVTVTYYNGSTSASSTNGTRYYCPGSGSVINPSFTLTQTGISGWAARGWSTGAGATAGITYSNGASFTRDTNCTLYGMYYQTITLTTYNGSSSATTNSGTRYYCPGSGSVVNPTFTVSAAALSGWSFNGWCTSSGATAGISYSSISGLELAANLTLYGRYSQTITLSYNGNGASGGSVAAQSGTRYWNSGNVANPTFTLQANGFTRNGYNFTAWALNGGTQYAAGTSIALAASATMYAVWTAIPAIPFYLGSKNLTYTVSGDVNSHREPISGYNYWQIQRNGYYARCQTSEFSRQGCTKVEFVCYRDGGYFIVGNKTIDLRGKYSGTNEKVVIDISDQPDTITCAIQAEGDKQGNGDGNSVQILNPYFY